MKQIITVGKCRFCNQTFSQTTIARHLNTCIQRQALIQKAHGQTRLFHIAVQGRYAPEYWLHLEVAADAKLKALDSFLRNIWLECCGHLSAFTIGEIRYNIYLERDSLFYSRHQEKSMNFNIGTLLDVGMRFIHEYDFGTTTTLALRVLSEREGKHNDEPIQIMARNEPPSIACDECGKPATQVCPHCIWNGKGWLCDKCGSKHECDEEILLPVVNSPRVGMCGYTGDCE